MVHAAEMVRVLKERYSNLTFTGHGAALGITIDSESSDEDNESDSNEDNLTTNGTNLSLGIPYRGRRSSIRIQTIKPN